MESRELTERPVGRGTGPMVITDNRPAKDVRESADAFSRYEFFLTDLMLAAGATKVDMEVPMPPIEARKDEMQTRITGTVLIAAVEGDMPIQARRTHDLGRGPSCGTYSRRGDFAI